MGLKVCCVTLLLLSVFAAAFARTPVSPTVIINTDEDVAECEDMVSRAKDSGSIAISFFWGNFLFTNYDGEGNIGGFCAATDQFSCSPLTVEKVLQLKSAFKACIKHAQKVGFKYIYFVPILNDGEHQGKWRNLMKLDPFGNAGGMTYFGNILGPMSDAVKETSDGRNAYIALTGEMNYALISSAGSWGKAVDALKARVGGHVRVGMVLNYNKMCPSPICPDQTYQPYPGQFDNAAIQALFKKVDWIGVSAYHPLSTNFAPSDLDSSMDNLGGELNYYGVDLKALAKTKEMHIGESGVGGGAPVVDNRCDSQQCGTYYNCKSNSAYDAATCPFFGVAGTYERSMDPWANNPSTEDFRHYYYTQLINFAKTKGRYDVRQCFIWCYGSYDVLGVHSLSTSDEGTYKDDGITKQIYNWNVHGQT